MRISELGHIKFNTIWTSDSLILSNHAPPNPKVLRAEFLSRLREVPDNRHSYCELLSQTTGLELMILERNRTYFLVKIFQDKLRFNTKMNRLKTCYLLVSIYRFAIVISNTYIMIFVGELVELKQFSHWMKVLYLFKPINHC